MGSKIENDLLLYWSGEADSKLSAEIEALLEKDTAAQRYLDELDQLNDLRDELADLPAMNPSRSFALEAVTERLVEKKIPRIPLPWIAAAVIVVIAVGTKSWFHEGTSQAEEVVVKEEEISSEPATRAKFPTVSFLHVLKIPLWNEFPSPVTGPANYEPNSTTYPTPNRENVKNEFLDDYFRCRSFGLRISSPCRGTPDR